MAINKKISELQNAPLLAKTDLFAVVQNGETCRSQLNNLSPVILPFTYIVDSNDKFMQWVNNNENYDYTSVLIKKGTYTYAGGGISLTNAGTKVVYGEAGSLIILSKSHSVSDNNYGLYYDSIPMTPDYYIFGVKIQSAGYGFTRCANLINCSSESFNASYLDCKRLTNCYGKSTGTGAENNAFRSSQFLVDCTGETTGYEWSVFAFCYDLVNCLVPNSSGSGYVGCKRISHCSSDADLQSNNFYDFISCHSMSHCRAKTRVSNAYASYTNNSTYAAADTANGGFNYIGSET